MNKLKIEHLKGYLGTGLKVIIFNDVKEMLGIDNVGGNFQIRVKWDEYYLSDIKPILKPMEMFDEDEREKYLTHINLKYGLDKLIPVKDIEFFQKSEVLKYLLDKNELRAMVSYWEFKKYLYQNHYDIHGLIDKGLAVDWREYN